MNDGFVSAFPPSEEDMAAYREREAHDLMVARDRWRLTLVKAGVPVEEAAEILAGLEGQGFEPRVTTDFGVLSGGVLYCESGNPNSIRVESLRLHQAWQRLEDPPDPPWVLCQVDPVHYPMLDPVACTNPEHGKHHQSMWRSMHQATPAEVEQIRAQQEGS